MFTIKRGNDEQDIEVVPDTLNKYYLGVKFKFAENSRFKDEIITNTEGK